MDKPIEDRIGIGGISDQIEPACYGKLASGQGLNHPGFTGDIFVQDLCVCSRSMRLLRLISYWHGIGPLILAVVGIRWRRGGAHCCTS